jgi:light-regulated signal transduction histidine kinase (bacteriophytochrome)
VRRAVQPAEIVARVWNDLPREGREVELEVGELPACMADGALLTQVITNLLDNALKYTRPRLRAKIEVGVETKDGDVAYFVRDNGVGFDPENAAGLFEVFRRLHDASEYEGNGVGLAIVHRIVTRHGGRVWAEGTSSGATFWFTLG